MQQPVPRMTHPHIHTATQLQSNSAALPQGHFPNLENYSAITRLFCYCVFHFHPCYKVMYLALECEMVGQYKYVVCNSWGRHKLQTVLDQRLWDLRWRQFVTCKAVISSQQYFCSYGKRSLAEHEKLSYYLFTYWVKILPLNIMHCDWEGMKTH